MYNLTEEQQKFIDIVDTTKEGEILLNAPAGTGKTFIIKYLYKKYRNEIIILAPTHKACTLFTKEGMKCITIHNFLNSDTDIDEETGETNFTCHSPSTKYFYNKKILVIDEASMVNSDMYSHLSELKNEMLVIYSADTHQLPPVNEEFSPIFRNVTNEIKFTKNMRSSDSVCAHYLDAFRKSIDLNIRVRIPDHKRILLKRVLKKYKKNPDNIVLLSWTNKNTNYYNNLIRSHLFKKNVDDKLEKYYKNEKLRFSGYRRLDCGRTYYTSNIITIKELIYYNEFVPFYRCDHNINHKSYDKYIIKCKECGIDGKRKLGYDVTFFKLTDGLKTDWIIPIDIINKKKVLEVLYHRKKCCKTLKEIEFWRRYYDLYNYYIPKLNYSYAMTIHKAQGSQWEHVVVDINNIRCARKLAPRLAYTAVSRMVHRAYFI